MKTVILSHSDNHCNYRSSNGVNGALIAQEQQEEGDGGFDCSERGSEGDFPTKRIRQDET